MRRYFFHLDGGHTQPGERYVQPDRVGVDFPTRAEAIRTALAYLDRVVRDDDPDTGSSFDWRLEVADEDGQTLLVLTLTSVAEDEPPPIRLSKPEPPL